MARWRVYWPKTNRPWDDGRVSHTGREGRAEKSAGVTTMVTEEQR